MLRRRVSFHTLGCKLNFSESSTLARQFAEGGFERVAPTAEADICVINSCSVTEHADKKCRNLIRRLHRRNPEAIIAVTGCYAQLKPQEIAAIDGVDIVLSNNDKGDLYRRVVELGAKGRQIVTSCTTDELTRFFAAFSGGDRTRAFLKVQDGCDYFCSYCTIPFARGRSRNGTIASMVKQAEEVASNGGKEIVLTGVNIGDFGKSTGETFIDLIRALDEVEGIVRYRISSIEPNLITDEAIDFVACSRRFAPHFHIPLQSGSDEVLKLMRRRYDTTLFRHKIEKIKEVMPHAFIGVDVIVGTRGETDTCFEEARTFIESLDISQLHVFSYSERPGTQALKIDHVVDPKTKHARSQQLLDISDRKLHAFYEAHIGQKANVLFEQTRKGGMMHGFTENYIKVEIPYDHSLVNETRQVILEGWNEDKTALVVKIIE